MTTRGTKPQDYDLHISEFDGNGGIEDGSRVVVELRESSKGRIKMTLPLVLAERLAYSLLCTSAVARGARRGENFGVGYPSDEVKISYDEVQCNGKLDFRARGQHGISILLSLETLRELRMAIEKIDR